MSHILMNDFSVECELDREEIFEQDELNEIKKGGSIWWANSISEIKEQSKLVFETVLIIIAIGIFSVNVMKSINSVGYKNYYRAGQTIADSDILIGRNYEK